MLRIGAPLLSISVSPINGKTDKVDYFLEDFRRLFGAINTGFGDEKATFQWL
jgi:hypothetical protein